MVRVRVGVRVKGLATIRCITYLTGPAGLVRFSKLDYTQHHLLVLIHNKEVAGLATRNDLLCLRSTVPEGPTAVD